MDAIIVINRIAIMRH